MVIECGTGDAEQVWFRFVPFAMFMQPARDRKKKSTKAQLILYLMSWKNHWFNAVNQLWKRVIIDKNIHMLFVVVYNRIGAKGKCL